MQEDDDEFGLNIDIDAPLPETAASHPTVVELATSSAAEQVSVTTGAASSATVSSSSSSSSSLVAGVTTAAADAALESPSSAGANDLMLPSLLSPFAEAAAAAASSSSSSSQRVSSSFDPPVLTAPSSRFLDLLTPIRSRRQDTGSRDDGSTPAATLSASTAAASAASEDDSGGAGSGVRSQLDAYKRKREEQSAARAALGGLLKRGGEDYIDLSAFAKPMQRPRPPPALSSSSSSSSSSFLSSPVSAPWMTRRYAHPNFTLRLHEELLDFAAFISPTSSEERQRAALLSRLSSLILSLFPSASVHPFGSYATKLYLPMSDIDVVVFDSPNVDATTGRTALELIADALRRQNWASYLEVIANARIPIVKFTDRETGLKVDVSRDASAGLAAARYVSSMSTKFPAFRPLLLFLKYFLHCRRLNDTYTGGIGSFLLQLLLLSHLHFHPAQTHDVNLGLLLLSFLDVYAHQLHYANVGLSLTPPSFYSKLRKQRYNSARPFLLSAENPLDVEHDVGSNSYCIMKVRKAWQFAFAVLTRREVMEGEVEGSLLALTAGAGTDDPIMKLRAEKKRKEAERKRDRRAARQDGEQVRKDRETEGEALSAEVEEVERQQDGERVKEDGTVTSGAAPALTADVAALKRMRVLSRQQRYAVRTAMRCDLSWQSLPEKEVAAFLQMEVTDDTARTQLLKWWKRRQKKVKKEKDKKERAAAKAARQQMQEESKDSSQHAEGQQHRREEDAKDSSTAAQISAAAAGGARAGQRRSVTESASASKSAQPRPRWLDLPKPAFRQYLDTEVVEKTIKRRMAHVWRQERKKEKEEAQAAAAQPQQEILQARPQEEHRQQQIAAPAAPQQQQQEQQQVSKKKQKAIKKKERQEQRQLKAAAAAAAGEQEKQAQAAAAEPSVLPSIQPEEKEPQQQEASREDAVAVAAAAEEKAAPAAALTTRQQRAQEMRQTVEEELLRRLSAERGGAAVDRQELYSGNRSLRRRFNLELLEEQGRQKAVRKAEQELRLSENEQRLRARAERMREEVKKAEAALEAAEQRKGQRRKRPQLIDLSVDDDDSEPVAPSSPVKRAKLEPVAVDGSSSLTASRGIKREAEEASAEEKQQSDGAGSGAAPKKRKT